VEVRPAAEFGAGALAELFNEGFSDYPVPLALDEAAFHDHIRSTDIDLDLSRVAVAERPVALALIARRGSETWVGGMGTAPAHRRRGFGERALVDGLQAARAAGCDAAWLEVIDSNDGAVALYNTLGFQIVRELVVWSLEADIAAPVAPVAPVASAAPAAPARDDLTVGSIEPAAARAWIDAHRSDREPWQRADASLERMREGGAELAAHGVVRAGATVAAVISRPRPGAVTVLQAVAVDPEATASALVTAAAGRGLHVSNLPGDSALAPVLERLGARPVLRQLEMRLAL
jgi:GNAT superfamily N-acetyltransferase